MTDPDQPSPLQSSNNSDLKLDLDLAPVSPPPAPLPAAVSAASTPPESPEPVAVPVPPPSPSAAASTPPAPAEEVADSEWKEIADPEDIRKHKGAAMIGYVFFFIPLIAADKSRFGRFHANQSLVILCIGGGLTLACFAAAKTVSYGLAWLEPINYFLSIPLYLLVGVCWIASLCMAVMGIVHAYNGEMTELPVIGAYRILK